MQDPPELAELLAAVRGFLETEVVPATDDRRLRFRARIAANVLAVAARELELREPLLRAELGRLAALLGTPAAEGAGANLHEQVQALNAELARRLRSGAIAAAPGDAVWDHLRRTAVEKLRIANPGYLDRIREA